MMVVGTIAWYVADKMIAQFIKEEGYGRLKKIFFPSKKYTKRLEKIIVDTIAVYEKTYCVNEVDGKFPFYHSQIIFDLLSQHVLFKADQSPLLIEEFAKNPNIIVPSKEQLENFYETFIDKVTNDKELRELHFDENYKATIFEISETVGRIEIKIDIITLKIDDLKDKLDRIENESNDIINIREKQNQLKGQLDKLSEELGKYEEDFKIQPENVYLNLTIERTKKEWQEIKRKLTETRDKEKEITEVIKKQYEFISNIDETTSSERLKNVKQFFLDGKVKEAIDLLNTSEREEELTAFLKSKESVERKAKNYAEEEVIIALNILRDVENASRMEDALAHFTLSLKCQRNIYNLFEIGKFYHDIVKFDQAEKYFQEVLMLYRIQERKEDRIFAAALNGIGLVLLEKGDFESAIKYFGRALGINTILFGEDNIETATNYSNLGLAWHVKGDLQQAIIYLKKALDIDLRVLEGSHLNIARDYNNLGMIERKSHGDLDAAIESLENAAMIILEAIGEESLEYANLCNNLGAVWQEKSEYDKAQQYFEYALKIVVKLIGDQNLNAVNIYINLGSLYWAKSDSANAIFFAQKAYDVSLRTYGAGQPSTAMALQNLNLYTNS